MKSNAEWKAWGKHDPLFAVSSWEGKGKNDASLTLQSIEKTGNNDYKTNVFQRILISPEYFIFATPASIPEPRPR